MLVIPRQVNLKVKILLFITRSNAGTESKVYLSTIDNTAIAGVDYIEVKQQELVFKANQKQLSYVVKTKADANLENTEAFDLGVYNSVKDKVPLSTGSGYIKDAVFLPDYYELKQIVLRLQLLMPLWQVEPYLIKIVSLSKEVQPLR